MSEQKKLVDMTVAELGIYDGELRVMRDRLIQEKTAIQAQLADLNLAMKETLPKPVLHSKNQQRRDLVALLMTNEQAVSGINARRAELQTVLEFKKASSFGHRQIRELIGIRDRWHEVSMDANTAPAVRRAAFKFSQELRVVLKPYFDTRNEA